MANEAVPLTDARRALRSEVISKVVDGAHVELTEHGHAIAVVIPIADYRRLTNPTGA